jgi:hypothetical protein
MDQGDGPRSVLACLFHCWRRQQRGGRRAALAFARSPAGGPRALSTSLQAKRSNPCRRLRRRGLLRRYAPRNDGRGPDSLVKQRRGCAFAFSRPFLPEALRFVPPSRSKRAQGKPDARCTRGLVCKYVQKKRTRAYRFSGGTPAFPARWLYGLLRALLGDRLVATVALRKNLPRNLTPASGRQDHTTSPYASAAHVNRSFRVHRIPPRVRDDRDPPLSSGEPGGIKRLTCPIREAIYFFARDWTGRIALQPFTNSASSRSAFRPPHTPSVPAFAAA